jgi:Flp pilus assembly protein TadG
MLSYAKCGAASRRVLAPRSGAAVVEFAVLAPIMAMLFMAGIDLARAYYYSTTINNCAWNGAMYASGVLTDPTWNAAGGGTTNSTIQACLVDSTNLNPALTSNNITVQGPSSPSPPTDANGNPVAIVTISYQFTTIGIYPGVPNPITITRTAQVRVVTGGGRSN